MVLFAAPPKLVEMAAENGTPLRRGEYFVKRVVAVEGRHCAGALASCEKHHARRVHIEAMAGVQIRKAGASECGHNAIFAVVRNNSTRFIGDDESVALVQHEWCFCCSHQWQRETCECVRR